MRCFDRQAVVGPRTLLSGLRVHGGQRLERGLQHPHSRFETSRDGLSRINACGDCAPCGNQFGSCTARRGNRKPHPQRASKSERVGWGGSHFDGQATQWIPEAEEDSDGVVHEYYTEAKERGLIAGACGYCAAFFEIDDTIDQAGIALDGGMREDTDGPGDHHGPDVAHLVEEGYQLINVG